MNILRFFVFGFSLAIGIVSYAVASATLPLTKESAAEQVQTKSGGKVLSVDAKDEAGKQHFRVKVLHDDGKIKVYQLDAETGREIK